MQLPYFFCAYTVLRAYSTLDESFPLYGVVLILVYGVTISINEMRENAARKRKIGTDLAQFTSKLPLGKPYAQLLLHLHHSDAHHQRNTVNQSEPSKHR